MKRLWSIFDLAEFLNKSPAWTRSNFLKLGIPGFKIGKQWRFEPSQIELWKENQLMQKTL